MFETFLIAIPREMQQQLTTIRLNTNRKAYKLPCNFNCCVETEGLTKVAVTGCQDMCKSGNISETVKTMVIRYLITMVKTETLLLQTSETTNKK